MFDKCSIDLLKNLNVSFVILRAYTQCTNGFTQHLQVQGFRQDTRVSLHYPRVRPIFPRLLISNRSTRFCENGSLHNILKRFGKFPESLVAVYISQILEGLVYLHDQGVIHDNVKGADILTNKDGTVKLADFGMAANTRRCSCWESILECVYSFLFLNSNLRCTQWLPR